MAEQKALIKKTQQQVLLDANLEQMRQKKEMDAADLFQRKSSGSTTIGPIGDGYQMQLARMQARDQANNQAYVNYQN